ncbi:hypothetical protein [Flavobacterium sp. HJSW_4]|uniref:hypothetical protein n=1 Tax=Flavobacterium sp. HJSW_4 TaxID=3344660 RepID=UPI0035F33B9B
MSNFKIIGTPNPEIGKEVIYKIGTSNLPVGVLPGQTNPFGSNPFMEEVKWSIYILESGKWILKEKNNKTGPTANYTFTEISLKRRGIRIVARLGEEKATLDIKPHDTIERKIVKVELCDALGNLQTKPFGYSQTVLAKVHCLNLDNCTVHVTLWEDDAPGKGHNEINKSNKAITKTERVSNGIAEVKFRLAPDFAKIADAKLAAGDKSEGKTHEYYVTAEVFRQETKSSNNINVINPNDNKTAANKALPAPVSQQKPAPKSTAPAAKKGPSKKEEKKVNETSSGSLFDWGESLLKAVPDILPSPSEMLNSVVKLFTPDGKDDEKETCSCKEYDLIWGSKVSCDFRHKVVEIAKNLGLPQEKYEGANWLMAVMALETINKFSAKIGTFKGSQHESHKYKYVGLIQFGKAAASSVGTTRTHLMSLSPEKQLFYVQKYFEQKQFKNLLKSKVALYLAVNYPEATKHASEKQYVVYDSSTSAYDNNPLFKREKDEFWIDRNGKRCYYEGREGASHIWEFDEAITEVYNEGKKYKEKEFNCNGTKSQKENNNKSKIVFFDSGLTEERKKVVSEFTIKLLEKAATNSSNDEVIITSTIRSTRKQAEIMYENENNGKHIRYASAGREVVKVFNDGKKDDKSKESIITLMDDKIKELAKNDSRVSRHCVPIEVYNKNNIIDISFTRGVKNPRDLIRELIKDDAVTKIIHPLNNVTANPKISYDSNEPAIHVEIKIT